MEVTTLGDRSLPKNALADEGSVINESKIVMCVVSEKGESDLHGKIVSQMIEGSTLMCDPTPQQWPGSSSPAPKPDKL